MKRSMSHNWMWTDAVAILTRTENLNRRFFQPRRGDKPSSWEPPVDILELETEVLILVALPGVNPDHVEAEIDRDMLIVSGRRNHPQQLRDAIIHRLEIPQGGFHRNIPLPAGTYTGISRTAFHGCLVFSLHKAV